MSAPGRFWNEKVLPHVPRFVRNDFWRLLFSLFFAVLLTAYAYRSVKMKTVMVKMHLKGIVVSFVPAPGESLELVPRETESTVDIDVEVPGDLKDLKNTDFYVECAVTKAQIDAKEPPPVSIKSENVKTRRVIDNLNVQAIRPERLPLDLDYFIEKDVPVILVYDGNDVMPGSRVVDGDADKRVKVRIRGPRKLLETIDHLETEKIPLSNMNRSFSRLVHPVLPYGMWNDNVRILTDAVRVDIRIEQKKLKPFESVPIRVLFGNGPHNLEVVKIEPETVRIEVDDVPDISADQLFPFVDVSNRTLPGEQSFDIKCWTGNDRIKEIKVDPAHVKVTLAPASPASK